MVVAIHLDSSRKCISALLRWQLCVGKG